MSEHRLTDVEAKGMVKILDKDGNVKTELEITHLTVNKDQLKRLKNATEQHSKR